TQLNDLAALGFLGLSPTYWKELRLAPTLIERIVADEWDERIDTVTRTFLGLTVSCARCHDHKFDPISREDYYGLAGVFASSQLAERPLLPAGEAMPVELARTQVRELEEKLSKLDKEDEAARSDVSRQIAMIRETTPHFDAPNVNILKDSAIYVLPDGPDQTRLEYRDGEARDLPVFERGNPASPGAIVERRFLTALSDDDPPPLGHGSGRLDLADALLGEARDLTARVIVNRIWEGHFGVGLVQTTSDFGSQGDPPSHPELLDFLASDLIRHDWSLKWLHREIVRSSTYRQTSLNRRDCAAVDPENRLLWRMNRRRLEIEMLRDAMLTAAGRLDRQAGGIAFDLGDDSQNRRTVYGRIARQDLNDVLRLYDFPEPESHSPQRVHTTSPLQQLYMLNAAFVRAMADQVAAQLVDLPTYNERVHTAYRKLFGRDPNEVELSFGREFLATAAADGAELTDYVHTLLGLNEFLYVD
ncbi:MAG: DUF1553 domain-containing protein, partial [Planctomycetaceae bacterium]|nr:DUF1553 domain-containing protein [Planctomycetaceae bacterium]